MKKYICQLFKKVEHVISTALVQDGIKLMESHLDGLSEVDKEQTD